MFKAFYYLLLLVLMPFLVLAQEESKELKESRQNLCDFIPDKAGKAKGLDIKFKVPCVWKARDGERPNVVKSFSYPIHHSSLQSTITIKKLPGILSKEETKEVFSPSGLKEISSEMGTFISGRTVQIDGLTSGEVEVTFDRELPSVKLYGHGIGYFIVYKKYMIALFYCAGGPEKGFADFLFQEFNSLFKTLASKTIIMEQWK